MASSQHKISSLGGGRGGSPGDRSLTPSSDPCFQPSLWARCFQLLPLISIFLGSKMFKGYTLLLPCCPWPSLRKQAEAKAVMDLVVGACLPGRRCFAGSKIWDIKSQEASLD